MSNRYNKINKGDYLLLNKNFFFISYKLCKQWWLKKCFRLIKGECLEWIHSIYKTNSLNGAEGGHSLTVSTMSVKKPKGIRGSGSSRKKSFKAPVMTWMSSQSLSSKFSFSSERQGGGEEGGGRREERMSGTARNPDMQGQAKWTKGEAICKRETKS